MSACHPRVRQGEQRKHLCSVFHQASEAHLRVTEMALDHPKRVLDLGSNLGLGLLDLAYRFVEGTAFSILFCRYCVGLQSTRSPRVPRALRADAHPRVARISADHMFLTVQQFADLRGVRNISRRDHRAVHQARLIINTDIGLGLKVILIALRSSGASRDPACSGCSWSSWGMNQGGIDDSALT